MISKDNDLSNNNNNLIKDGNINNNLQQFFYCSYIMFKTLYWLIN